MPTTAPEASPREGGVEIREATVQDIERIDSIGLDELGLDASGVQLPEKAEGERLSDEELQLRITTVCVCTVNGAAPAVPGCIVTAAACHR